MNPLNPPEKFIIDSRFKHHNPEYIREIARSYGFERKQEAGRFGKSRSRRSEIWMLVNEKGWWFVRMDDQGHNTGYHFGSRPHYHKEWMGNPKHVTKYLEGPSDKVYSYDDVGALIGRGNGSDLKAKQQHIPR